MARDDEQLDLWIKKFNESPEQAAKEYGEETLNGYEAIHRDERLESP